MDIITRRQNEKMQIVLSDYYSDARHVEKPYTDGLYGVLPTGLVKNFWAHGNKKCKDWMEWAYNNPYQPAARWNERFQKYMPFLDDSHANAIHNLGSMKAIWEKFARQERLYALPLDALDINQIEEDFWQYYIRHYSKMFDTAVQMFEAYIRDRRDTMTDEERELERQHAPFFADDNVWVHGCRDYLKHLVYTSPRGYLMELTLFAALCEHTGGKYVESTPQDERNGIDGYLVVKGEKIPISVKPSTYNNQTQSPLCKQCWVKYYPFSYAPDLVFEFQTGEDIWN